MFAKARNRHERSGSNATSAPTAPPLVSPLRMDFDFDLSPPSSSNAAYRPSDDSIRPRTNDGLGVEGNRKSVVSLLPPILPPIPRVASKYEAAPKGEGDSANQSASTARPRMGRREASDDGSVFSFNSHRAPSTASLSFDHLLDSLGGPRPDSSTVPAQTSPTDTLSHSLNTTPKMESSIFPRVASSPMLPPINTGPPMTREFIDSRDKPYNPTFRPNPVQSSYSSPHVPTLQSQSAHPAALAPPSPLAPNSATTPPVETPLLGVQANASRLGHSASSDDLRAGHPKTPGTSSNNHFGTPVPNGSTIGRSAPRAPISPVESAASRISPPLMQTIGTPYQQTSPSFPLPQLVTTRPKTAGATSSSTIAGVNVPTHHTSTQKSEPARVERRKNRLLNPMALLSRRKSAHDGEIVMADKSAAAQAYARQKSVAAVGVHKLPEDFDPRIKGKVVHDFSAPRPARRNFSYNDADRHPTNQTLSSSADSAPSLPHVVSNHTPSSGHTKNASEGSNNRRSAYSPMFREHLAETPDAHRRISSLNAERLENKDFIQRVSHHSSVSTFSQESAVLPPFARRSQTFDPSQATFFFDADSKRSSDPLSAKERDSTVSSNGISPIATRTSNPLADQRSSFGQNSLSPVSPASPDKAGRPVSDFSILSSPGSGESRLRSPSESTARPRSVVLPVPTVSTIAEDQSSRSSVEETPTRNGTRQVELLDVPRRDSSFAADLSDAQATTPDKSSAVVTPDRTPDIAVVDSFLATRVPQGPPRLVEKRASAVGHAKRTSSTPKHRVSNASRFSFQFGESAAEEQALEDKHRKVASMSGNSGPDAPPSPDEDEDDFDEGAMDDMDEFEVQERQQPLQQPIGASHTMSSNGLLLVHDPRSKQVADSSEGSVYDEDDIPSVTDERDLTYADHPAFRAHSAIATSHSRGGSLQTGPWPGSDYDAYASRGGSPESTRRHERPASGDSTSTVSTNANAAPSDAVLGNGISSREASSQPHSDFYMQPHAAGYASLASPINPKPPLPHRDSGNSERNRAASGMSFGSTGASSRNEVPQDAVPATLAEKRSRCISGQALVSPTRTNPTGLGFNNFSGFKFVDSSGSSAANTRPSTSDVGQGAGSNSHGQEFNTASKRDTWSALTKVSSKESAPASHETRPAYLSSSTGSDSAAYHGSIGKGIRARQAQTNQNRQYASSDSGDDGGNDDMYFDDGGFDQDIRNPHHNRFDSMDEDVLDSDAFALNPNRIGRANAHQRDTSAMTIASLGSDGPYPTFAMGAKPLEARQRQTHFLLEDLPLMGPVDPKLIPQRNPSEDAKRLGLSTKVPPLPAQPGSKEAMVRMQANLQTYHATLAEALNRAAAEGRFHRQASVSTAHSVDRESSVAADSMHPDDRSQYSIDEGEEHQTTGLGVPSAARARVSINPNAAQINDPQSYSPLKLNFDFGFESQLGEGGFGDDFGGEEEDDDIVAAANAEALASDDDGFYGQEFGFYARARANSGDGVEAVNGGYFGADGDDGLTRKKSTKDPNLTPITERSEFSTRNSFINLGHGSAFGMPSAGPFGAASPALARLPTSPLVEGEVNSFDQLRKLRANAFGGSNGSLRSDGRTNSWQAGHSPSHSARSSANPHNSGISPGIFLGGGAVGGSPKTYAQSTGSSGSSNPSSAHPSGSGSGWYGNTYNHQVHQHRNSGNSHESPRSATSSGQFGYSPPVPAAAVPVNDRDSTPRRVPEPQTKLAMSAVTSPAEPTASSAVAEDARKGGGDSVTYIREDDPAGTGAPRWVLERRRTSQQGQLELVGREVVKGGWI